MVHVYRAAVYLIMILVALLLYFLLRRVFASRTRMLPLVGALLAATGLLWGTYYVLSKPLLLHKHAKFLWIKKEGRRNSMVFLQSEAWICNQDGTEDRQFLPLDYITTRDLCWSWDGTRILATRVRTGAEGMQVFSYDPNGENKIQVTSGRGICRRPSWSPDGTQIVYDFRPNLRQKVTEIFVINADGSGRRRLTSRDQINANHPVWSPDGRSIYFCARVKHAKGDLWVMDADGSNLRQLTFTPDQAETEPSISPDGSTIVLSINRRQIYLMDADGGRLRPLTTKDGTACRGRDPSWHPDGRQILFTGFEASGAEQENEVRRSIKIFNLDGTALRHVALSKGKFLNPVLHPAGGRLAYLRSIRSVIRGAPARPGQAGQQLGQNVIMGGDEE